MRPTGDVDPAAQRLAQRIGGHPSRPDRSEHAARRHKWSCKRCTFPFGHSALAVLGKYPL